MESFTRFISATRVRCVSFLSHVSRIRKLVFVAALLFIVAFWFVAAPPAHFISGSTVRIVAGTSAPQIAAELASAHLIAHPTVFRAILRLTSESNNIQSGVYLFETPQDVFTIIYRLVVGAYGLPPVRITFIEGTTIREMAAQVANAFPGLSADNFQAAAGSEEGYLFPDTYFFQPSDDSDSIVAAMRANFNKKILTLSDEIRASGHSLSDIVTVASLVEKEARTSVDRRMVAGILWNRVRLGMPLQVDAVFGYILNRGTYSPSPADLKVASPYNTYLHTGLPPGPIDNPGIDSLTAAAASTKTNYLYYLTGKDGLMHYATTYAGHEANLRKYLE